MKRASSAITTPPKSPAKTGEYTPKVLATDVPKAPEAQRLTAESAGQRAAALLSSDPPQKEAFARLLDQMHTDGVRKLMLCNTRLGSRAYAILLEEFNKEGRLNGQIDELDFSHTEFPQITSLLKAIEAHSYGTLLSLNLEDTYFSPQRCDTAVEGVRVGLQPSHLDLVVKIAERNPGMKALNLNNQALLGSTKDRTIPQAFDRDAPIYRLMKHCRKGCGLEVLSLKDCGLSTHDIRDISDMLYVAHGSERMPLRELYLQQNDPSGLYDYASFLGGLNGHPTLEKLGLPDSACESCQRAELQRQDKLASYVDDCERLICLEPEALSQWPAISKVLSKRQADLQQAQLLHRV